MESITNKESIEMELNWLLIRLTFHWFHWQFKWQEFDSDKFENHWIITSTGFYQGNDDQQLWNLYPSLPPPLTLFLFGNNNKNQKKNKQIEIEIEIEIEI